MEIFDVHHHIGALHDVYWEQPTDVIAEHHIAVMDRLGVAGCAVMPTPTYTNPTGLADSQQVNDEIAALLETHPNRFRVGFGTVEPLYGEAGFAEVDRVVGELGLDGLMWHNRWQSEYVDAAIMYDLVERVAANDSMAVLHAHCDSEMTAPWRIFDVAETFPDVTFLVVDAFSSVLQGKQIISELRHRALDNIVFDTALVTNFDRQIVPYVDVIGEDNLVFGSDLYSHADRPYTPNPVGQIEASAFSPVQKRKVFYENARRMFDL